MVEENDYIVDLIWVVFSQNFGIYNIPASDQIEVKSSYANITARLIFSWKNIRYFQSRSQLNCWILVFILSIVFFFLLFSSFNSLSYLFKISFLLIIYFTNFYYFYISNWTDICIYSMYWCDAICKAICIEYRIAMSQNLVMWFLKPFILFNHG